MGSVYKWGQSKNSSTISLKMRLVPEVFTLTPFIEVFTLTPFIYLPFRADDPGRAIVVKTFFRQGDSRLAVTS